MAAAKRINDFQPRTYQFNEEQKKRYEHLKENIKLYIDYLRTYLKTFFKEDFSIEEYDSKNLAFDHNQNPFYGISISSKEIMHHNYSNIINGPIPKIYEMKGVIDIKLGSMDKIRVVYDLNFFDNTELFNNIKTIDRFNL
jgi:hypothetical protein